MNMVYSLYLELRISAGTGREGEREKEGRVKYKSFNWKTQTERDQK